MTRLIWVQQFENAFQVIEHSVSFLFCFFFLFLYFLVVLLLAFDITLGGLGADPILNPAGVGVPVGVKDGVPNPPGVPPAAESR